MPNKILKILLKGQKRDNEERKEIGSYLDSISAQGQEFKNYLLIANALIQ